METLRLKREGSDSLEGGSTAVGYLTRGPVGPSQCPPALWLILSCDLRIRNNPGTQES